MDITDTCYKSQVFEALNYLWYHSSTRANPFRRVCPFRFYGICNEQESDSACVYGKISVLFMISVKHLHFSEIEGSGTKFVFLVSHYRLSYW